MGFVLKERTMRSLTIASLAALQLGLSGAAHAAQIETMPDQKSGYTLIAVEGTFELGDEKRFIEKALPVDKGIVVLNSEGGNARTGIEIGKAIRLKGFWTYVPDDRVCASACGLAWLGGTQRLASQSALVGFHAVYTTDKGVANESGPGNALVGAYLSEIGLGPDAIAYATSASPDNMNWLSMPVARLYGIEATFLPTETAAASPAAAPKTAGSDPAALKQIAHADIFGFDLPGMPLKGHTLQYCDATCAADPNCKAYTYTDHNSACYLKSGGYRVVGHRLATTGYKPEIEHRLRASPISISVRTDLPGHDYRELKDLTLADCIAVCEQDGQCAAFTYVKRHQRCWLKSSVSSGMSSPIATSGIKAAID
jgi:hypothetical protein